jgi:hypothetical protein
MKTKPVWAGFKIVEEVRAEIVQYSMFFCQHAALAYQPSFPLK